jgi:hypothetical protein
MIYYRSETIKISINLKWSIFYYHMCMFLRLSFFNISPTLFLHLPRSHYENPGCLHWLRCLDVAQKAMPIIQLCSMAPDITGLNSLSCFPLYMIGVVWLQEWRLRGDRLGLLRNSVESCSMVLQKLSERWASAGTLILKLCLTCRSVSGKVKTRCC